jgi:hypothetical protein
MHTNISKPPTCRWCDQQPEFVPTIVDERICPHCGAMQDPVIKLRGPQGLTALSFFVNPDDSIFFEVFRPREGTTRYEFSPAQLAKAGAFLKTPLTLNGKKIDKPL